MSQCPSVTPSSAHPLDLEPLDPFLPSSSQPPASIVPYLCKLTSMRGRKSILKKLDYNILSTIEVDFLPFYFDGDSLFFLPPLGAFSFLSNSKSMDGMNKHYNHHVWTKIQTTNITNDLTLALCSSTYVSHLQCKNPQGDYVQQAHQTSTLNNTNFDGFMKEPFCCQRCIPF